MLSRTRSAAPMIVALAALGVALSTTSYAADAARAITGRDVKNSSLTGKDVKDSSLTGADVKDGSLRVIDLTAGDLPPGPTGPAGPKGDKGEKGDRAQVVGADVTKVITGDAGSVASHSCTSANIEVAGALVGDVPVLAFVGPTAVPAGLTFQLLRINAPGTGILRFCNVTNVASPAFSDVGVRILTLR